MASPIKDGGPSHTGVIDALMMSAPDAELQGAMDERKDMFDVRVRAVDVVRRDRMLPKYRRLGMKRIAWLFRVTENTLYEWWDAYKRDKVDALRSRPGDRGRKRDIPIETLREARDALLARNPQAEAARNVEAARKSRDAGGGAADKEKEEEGAAGAAGGGGKVECKAGGDASGAECIACMIAAGLMPDGEWYTGRDGVPRPGRRGWRQGRGGCAAQPRPPRCKCKGHCTTPSGRKRSRCVCKPGRLCRCPCCAPLKPPPLGPPHAKGCPALRTAPPRSLLPDEFGEEIRKRTGRVYSRSHLYVLMALVGLSSKTVTKILVNRATRRSILQWQARIDGRLDRLRKKGYTVLAMDEAFLVEGTLRGRKHWSLVGERIAQLHTGSHGRVALHCAYAEDGRRLMTTYTRSDSYTFVDFLKEITAKFGKVAVLVDNYSAHFSCLVRDFIKKNRKERPDRDIRLVRLPVGCPFLNVVEQCWSQLKRKVVVGEHHSTIRDLRRAAAEFMRTAQFNMSLADYIHADPPPVAAAA